MVGSFCPLITTHVTPSLPSQKMEGWVVPQRGDPSLLVIVQWSTDPISQHCSGVLEGPQTGAVENDVIVDLKEEFGGDCEVTTLTHHRVAGSGEVVCRRKPAALDPRALCSMSLQKEVDRLRREKPQGGRQSVWTSILSRSGSIATSGLNSHWVSTSIRSGSSSRRTSGRGPRGSSSGNSWALPGVK